MKVNGNIVLNDNASGELRHVYIERVADDVTGLTPAHTGRLIFNTTSSQYKFWDGAAWQTFAQGGATSDIQAELNRVEAALGAFIAADGSFDAAALSGLTNIDVSGATSLLDVLEAINAELDTASALGELTDVVLGALAARQGLFYDAGTSKWVNRLAVLADISDVTATVTEVNHLTGVTSNVQEQIDALGDAADGKQDVITGAATTIVADDLAPELVVVSTAAGKIGVAETSVEEINRLVGVTSSVQEQLDAKQAALGFVPVNKAGDSVNGNLAFGGTSTVKNLSAPVDEFDAIRKIDLDNAVAGIARDFQADVLGTEATFVAETSEAGRYIFGAGTTFVAGDTGAAAGDIVEVDAEGTVLSVAYDVSVEGPGALTWNRNVEGWYQWNGTVWSTFGGLSGVNAGVGLVKTGNTISVLLGAGVADLPTGEVGLDLKTDGGLILVDPATGVASTAAEAVLAAKLDGTTLKSGVNGLAVNLITQANIDTDALGNGLTGGEGTVLSVELAATDSLLEFVAGGLAVDKEAVVDALGDTFLELAGGTMTGPIVLAGAATAAQHAVPLAQLEGAINEVNTVVDSVIESLNKSYHAHTYTNTGATAVITVTHNIGVKYCNVTVVDEEDEVFIPQSIKFIDENTLEVTLNTDISGTVVVMGHATLTPRVLA